MRGEVERMSTGWLQVNLRIRPSELQNLIAALQRLDDNTHFHLRGNFESDVPGIGDVEISLQGEAEPDNLLLE